MESLHKISWLPASWDAQETEQWGMKLLQAEAKEKGLKIKPESLTVSKTTKGGTSFMVLAE